MKHAHRRAHARLATLMAIALPLILLAALLSRQEPAAAPPPQRLSEPAQ